MRPDPLVAATRSADKAHELSELFRRCGRSIVTLADLGIEPIPEEVLLEDADTFEGNAVAKARFFSRYLGGLAMVADDSGLEVESLGGRPGVRSKRWSGRIDVSGMELDAANNERLIRELAGKANRRARYVCVAALVDGERELTFRGTTGGSILNEARGHNGFGYDAYFLSDELGKTFGEASLEEKQGVSHRARAFGALIAALGECG